jgi:hypothetical protein
VQAILPKYGMSNWKKKTRQFAVEKVAENSVAESEKLVMNQILISKCLKIKKFLLQRVN